MVRIEKDCTEWAHGRLKEILIEAKTIYDGKSLKVIKVNSVEGEVSVNVRKGRIRQIFDLNLGLKCQYGEEEVDAKITDFMSDMDYAGFEFNLTGVKGAAHDTLKKVVWERLNEFKAEVENVQGNPLLIDAAQAPTSNGPKSGGALNDAVERAPSTASPGTGSIEERIDFASPMEQVWLCLTDVPRIMAWTRGTAQLSSVEPGAPFSLLNGNITGLVTSMSTGSLKMDWRLKQWASERVTKVEISLTGKGSESVLKFKQIGIPSGEVDAVKENWHRYYWEPIKALLGCGNVSF